VTVEQLFAQWLALLGALWWPFVRALSLLSATPVIGENMVPIAVRVLLALVIAVVLLPVAQPPEAVEAFSLAAVVLTIEQVVIGVAIGLALHLTMAVIMVLGYMVSSQMGLAMAQMNDPMNGTSSDVVSTLLYILSILVFFSIDGHLVVAGVLGRSFDAWPVGAAIPAPALQSVAFSVAWVFAAALLLAAPVIFSALVVQIGFGFLNRIAPSFNLFSLGFSLVTVFGLFMLTQLVRFVPDHYVRMTNQVLGMLGRHLGG
jgi:flagellar biosynthetic protein FliR